MFEPVPGFEELTIRLNVEWGERQRPVEARLERWPQSRRVVLVCHFEDDPQHGEWVVMDGRRRPHFVGNPEKLLFYRAQWNILTRRPFTTQHFKDKQLKRLKTVVRLAFEGHFNLRVARLLEFPDWPQEPRLLIWRSDGAWWCHDWSVLNTTRFDWSPSPLHLSAQQMLDLVPLKWNEPDSDMRFAWEWAQRSDQERKALCCGGPCDFEELERVMLWVLQCSQQLWDSGSSWEWTLHPEFAERGYVTNSTPAARPFMLSLSAWQEWLFAYFAPEWRGDWLINHACVREFWQREGAFQHVRLDEVPTMHERLEARLELRAWLEGKASPEAREALLSSL